MERAALVAVALLAGCPEGYVECDLPPEAEWYQAGCVAGGEAALELAIAHLARGAACETTAMASIDDERAIAESASCDAPGAERSKSDTPDVVTCTNTVSRGFSDCANSAYAAARPEC
mgnify:FL=1